MKNQLIILDKSDKIKMLLQTVALTLVNKIGGDKMKKVNKVISFVLTFLFMATIIPKMNMQVKADETQMPAVDTVATLTGDFLSKNGLGEDWKPQSNTKTVMTEYSNGIYEITVDFKAAGDYQYKVALNRSFDKAYPSDNRKISVTAPGKVIVRFDLKKGEVIDNINDKDKFKTSATLVGSLSFNGGQDWNPGDSTFQLQYIGGGYYKGTFKFKTGSCEYKVAYNNKWSNGEVGSNIKLTLDKEQDVTFLANPVTNVCVDSISNPEILTAVSLIGTVRGDEGANWNQKLTGYEMDYATGDGKFITAKILNKGNYSYKAVRNYDWANVVSGQPADKDGNKTLAITEDSKYVVFVADLKEGKIYDSVNDADKVAELLGLKAPKVDVKSPVINADGTVTFSLKNPEAKAVYLAGAMTGWGDGKKLMSKDKDGVWSIKLRLGDVGQDWEYKFIVDGNWIADPSNINKKGDNSLVTTTDYAGRKVVLAGTIQSVAGEGNWTPGSDKTKLSYDGNGLYSITIKNVPAGSYEYKIAMGSWDENYGQNGAKDGSNIQLTVPKNEDVKFIYSDDSHNIVDSTTYKVVDATLVGTGIADKTKLKDGNLSGVYSVKVNLKKGEYKDLKLVVDNKEISIDNISITDDSKDVTISYDATTGIVFNDLSSKKIDLSKLYYNSREAMYKSPYGAVPTDSTVTFNLKAAKDDLTKAMLVLVTPEGLNTYDMKKNGSFADDSNSDRWTVDYNAKKIGMYKYYFVISNGSDVKAYGDDDGYFGAGKGDNLGQVKQYDMNIYDKNFKTPDWFKNAVVYQIFPDRFFNGDESNDYLQKFARGNMPYEFYTNWYAVPEDPEIEMKDGKPNPDYKGTKGDGNWSNEMYGGDLKGINAKLNYLQALGVNVLYLNPASKSISNHRYDTTDYGQIDPLLGHMEDFVNLTIEAKKRGMHVILDGVFNHVSDDSVYFDRYAKYIEKGKALGAYQYWSKVYDLVNKDKMTQADAEKKVVADYTAMGITDFHYKEWFVVNNKVIDDGKPTMHYDYEGWWGYDSMPVVQALNGSEYNVKSWDQEIIDGKDANSRFWLKQGSSGWRLDVANEVSDETWRHFRGAVKEEGDNVIIGEIWTDASKYLLGDMYDSVMNYRFRGSILNFVSGSDEGGKVISATQSMNELEAMREQYPKEAFEAMLNLMDSHDTQRVISSLDGYKKSQKAVAADPTKEALAKMKMVPLLQMTYPGAPTIYYGDEAGMPGADDPDNRRGMIWGKGNQELVEWYAKLANIRDAYSVLRTGDIVPMTVAADEANDVMAYSRNNDSNHALIAVNRKTTDIGGLKLDASAIPEGTVLTNVLNPSETYTVKDSSVTVKVPKQSGVILVASYKAVTVNNSALKDVYDPSFIVKDKVSVTAMTLDKTAADVNTGNTIQLTANVQPEPATLKNVTWSSSDESIAKVDANGVVTGIKEGTATITAVTLDGDFKASCAINVHMSVVPLVPSTPVPSVLIPATPITLPKTGSPIDMNVLVLIGLALVGSGSVLRFRKR